MLIYSSGNLLKLTIKYLKLFFSRKRLKFISLRTNHEFLLTGSKVKLIWRTQNCLFLKLTVNGKTHGYYLPNQCATILVTDILIYTVTAVSPFRSITKTYFNVGKSLLIKSLEAEILINNVPDTTRIFNHTIIAKREPIAFPIDTISKLFSRDTYIEIANTDDNDLLNSLLVTKKEY